MKLKSNKKQLVFKSEKFQFLHFNFFSTKSKDKSNQKLIEDTNEIKKIKQKELMKLILTTLDEC